MIISKNYLENVYSIYDWETQRAVIRSTAIKNVMSHKDVSLW